MCGSQFFHHKFYKHVFIERLTFIPTKGICDGAAALVLASEAAVKTYNLTPLARLVSYGIAGTNQWPIVFIFITSFERRNRHTVE